MKKIFTLFTAVLLYIAVNAQCTITGFDNCSGSPSSTVTNFNGAVLVSGTALTTGAKYKFNNITPGVAAIISIDKMSNAIMTGSGVSNPSIDDDAAANETGTAGSHSSLFAPRIAPNQTLTCTNVRGYVQFTITFYTQYAGNSLPATSPIGLTDLNFLHFDMDGHTVGSNGWFKEIGYVKRVSVSPINPVNITSTGTELTSGGVVSDADGDWFLTFGSTVERDGVSRCAQVIEKSVYTGSQSSVSFRFGYDYKAPSPCAGANDGQPTRQYGSKFGCFNLPGGGPLPVSLTGFGVSYNNGTSTVNWTTSQEINLSTYEVQRSTDGINFETIGNVASRNSLNEQKYFYQDNNIPSGVSIVYYRLKIIDRDNSFKLSKIITIKITNTKLKQLVVSPNPASYDAQVKLYADKAGVASINVFDATGKSVLQQQSNVLAGNNSIVINNVIKLGEGMYTVKLVTSNETYSSKLIIWK